MPTVINTDHEVGGRGNQAAYFDRRSEMALFRRKSPTTADAQISAEFQRLSIRQIILHGYLTNRTIFLHCEKNGINYLKGTLNREEWFELPVESRAHGDELMLGIKADIKSSITIGLLPEGSYIPYGGNSFFGFAEVDFEVNPERYTPDYLFALGRELDLKLQDGWLPVSQTESTLILNYFAFAPLKAGYFGPFKFILKRLTDSFDDFVSKSSNDDSSYLAAAIGFGYGRIEGFTSRVRMSPQYDRTENTEVIASLPELGGSKFPQLKTLQYLMRKGVRFLDHLEMNHDARIATRFKIHTLRGADLGHEESGYPEERYLEFQQLTTRIVYQGTDLARRDREARKVELGSRKERQNIEISQLFKMSITPDEITMYKNWLKHLRGKNSAVAHFAIALTQSFPEIEINWNESLIKTLFISESQYAQTKVWEAIHNAPKLLRVIPAEALVEYIDKADSVGLAMVLKEIKENRWSYTRVINLWVSSHVDTELSKRDLEIAALFLQIAWSNIPNSTYGAGEIPMRDTLFLQVAKQTQLEPFANWKDVLRIYIWDEQNFLAFYGVAANEKYKQGILDVLNLNSSELLEFFARPIASYIVSANSEKVIRVLSAFMNSPKPGSADLVWMILGEQKISSDRIVVFLDHLDKMDPSGEPYLKALASAIKLGDAATVLRYLNALSPENKETFWRRNAAEVEATLMSWKEFPAFFWKNLNSIPPRTASKLSRYVDLAPKVLKQITPSAIAKMNSAQISFFVTMVKADSQIWQDTSMLRAMLIAPDARINELAANYVKEENKYSAHWLLMLESNLPITQQAALNYLKAQIESSDFASTLLMALDSNNTGARKMALNVLASVKSPTVLRSIVDGLVENRNSDTWKVVSKNLELVSTSERYKEFTSHVFLSRRKARQVKEEIKIDIEDLIEDIAEAVEIDTLIRLAHSSVASDRNWALKQIALTGIEIEGVTVERAWSGSSNV